MVEDGGGGGTVVVVTRGRVPGVAAAGGVAVPSSPSKAPSPFAKAHTASWFSS